MRILAISAATFSFISTVHSFCASEAGSRDQLTQIQHQLSVFAANASSLPKGPTINAAASIDVFWNVFYDRDDPKDGNIS